MTTRTRSRVEAAEMRVLRMIAEVSRLEKRRSAEIREELRVESVLILVERRWLSWFGHLKRMEGTRYPARFFELRPRGKRPSGRPRQRWMDCLEKAVERRGTTMEAIEEEELFLNRQWWRGFANDRALP